MKDFLKIAAVVLALGLAARGAWGVLTGALGGGMFAPADYTETVQTGGELEAAYLAVALNMPYDPAGTSIPVLLLAADSSDVIELDGMQRIFDALPGPKAMARRTGANHGQMLYTADGYVTAWLLWHLQGDEAAARAFTGAAPELASNPLYQDVRLAC